MLHMYRLQFVILMIWVVVIIFEPVYILPDVVRVGNLSWTDSSATWMVYLNVHLLEIKPIVLTLGLLLELLVRRRADPRILMVLEVAVAHASILLLLHTVFEFDLIRLQNQRVVIWIELWLRNVHTLVLHVVRRFAIKISLLTIHVRRYGHRCAFKIAFRETFLFEWWPDIWLIRVLIRPQGLGGFLLVR
jgi:hypothetical protein